MRASSTLVALGMVSLLAAPTVDAATVAHEGFDSPGTVSAILAAAGHTPTALTSTQVAGGSLVSGGSPAFDVFVISRNTTFSGSSTAYAAAVQAYIDAGGNIVTEWSGGNMFFSSYASDIRFPAQRQPQLRTFQGSVHAGDFHATDTPINIRDPSHPTVQGLANPLRDGSGTEFFFWIENPDPDLEVVADFVGNGRSGFPVGQNLPTLLAGCSGESTFAIGTWDWSDTLTSGSKHARFLTNSVAYAAGSSACACFVVDAIDDRFSVINDGTASDLLVLANDECGSDKPISVVVEAGDLQPDRGGSATTDGTKVVYRPAAGFVGFEEFRYTARDAGLKGAPPAVDRDAAVILVEVLADLAVDAADDAATTLQTQAAIIEVLENDSPGNPPSELTIETAPAHGSATLLSDDTIRYVPNSNFFGEDSFEYRLTDTNGDSDVATVTVGVFFVDGEVPIDIMPNDAGNNVNLRAGPGAGFDVAILSVGEFFDAPAVIDPLALKLGPREANIWGDARARDVDGDGDEDLLVKFLTQQTGIACGDTEASLSGRTFEFQPISGSDAINTFNCPRARKRY